MPSGISNIMELLTTRVAFKVGRRREAVRLLTTNF
jgi:hypothetical protein